MSAPEIAWKPSASMDALRQRALFLAAIRGFFTERAYLEVETPIMARFGVTDVYLNNIKASFRGRDFYLQTSPEYHMKRLLAAGSGPIFQLARVFRDDELGRWHNPEFTLLEWYQLDVNHHTLMEETDLLLQELLQSKPMIKKTYQEIFWEKLNIDPFRASLREFQDLLKGYELDRVLPQNETDRDQYLFLIMSHIIEPALAKEESPIAIYNFPASQASLAKINQDFAERFEVYYQGVELANGFHELTELKAQAKRFEWDQEIRQKKAQPFMESDHYLLSALEHGLPSCSGVALGVDRLLALALEKSSLASILAFDFSRA